MQCSVLFCLFTTFTKLKSNGVTLKGFSEESLHQFFSHMLVSEAASHPVCSSIPVLMGLGFSSSFFALVKNATPLIVVSVSKCKCMVNFPHMGEKLLGFRSWSSLNLLGTSNGVYQWVL